MSGKVLEQRIFLLIDGTVDEVLEGFITDRKRGENENCLDWQELPKESPKQYRQGEKSTPPLQARNKDEINLQIL